MQSVKMHPCSALATTEPPPGAASGGIAITIVGIAFIPFFATLITTPLAIGETSDAIYYSAIIGSCLTLLISSILLSYFARKLIKHFIV